MTVAEKISALNEEREELEERYCENCQEWYCDNCWAELRGEQDETD